MRLRWIAVVVYAAGIFAASSIPAHSIPKAALFGFDKVIHFFVYAGLGAVVAWAWDRIWLAILVCAVYGALDEFHQHFTPGRSVEFADFVADALGATAGVLLNLLIRRYRRPHGADPQLP